MRILWETTQHCTRKLYKCLYGSMHWIFVWNHQPGSINKKKVTGLASMLVHSIRGVTVCSYGYSHRKDLCWSEINPVWNPDSRVVPQGSPRRTFVMVSVAATFHQFSLLCGQHCAWQNMPPHLRGDNAGPLTVLVFHSNSLTSNMLTFLFWPACGPSNRGPSEMHRPEQMTSSASCFFPGLTATFSVNASEMHPSSSRQGRDMLSL